MKRSLLDFSYGFLGIELSIPFDVCIFLHGTLCLHVLWNLDPEVTKQESWVVVNGLEGNHYFNPELGILGHPLLGHCSVL